MLNRKINHKRKTHIETGALIVASLEKIYAYNGVIKGRLTLENLNKKSDSSWYILVSSEVKPKTLLLVEGDLPLSILNFTKIEGEEALKYVGKKLANPVYIARLNFPDLVNKSINELWMGDFFIDFERVGVVQFAAKRNLASELQSLGDPDSIKRNIDSVRLRPDLGGNAILEAEGWALNEKGVSCSVALFFDDEKKTTTLTNKMRQDVLEFYKLNIPVTPGFIVEAKLPTPTPKHISLLIRADDDAVVLRFPFEKIPGASKYEVIEETIFKEYLSDNKEIESPIEVNFAKFTRSIQSVTKPISIIIPTNLSTENIYPLILALREAYAQDEIIVIAHGVSAANKNKLGDLADKVIQVEGKFNWSKFNNKGASVAKNNTLLFMNDDVLPISTNWRSVLARSIECNPTYGAIGARLIGKDLKIQHDGISLYGKFTDHINVGLNSLPNLDSQYIEVDAVTGAFLVTSKALFKQVGGFDESLNIIGNDLDYCLRVGSMGKKALIPSNLVYYHAEGSSRANLIDNNINDSLDARLPSSGRFRILDGDRSVDDGAEKIVIYKRESLNPRSIALIKIDHIGDFYSSLDGMTNLKNAFPSAKLSLICSPEVAQIAKKMHIFTDIYPVRVFNKVSGSGLDFKSFPQALKQRKFDIAVDYRKHDEVREILSQIKAEHKFCFNSSTAQDQSGITYFSGHTEAKGVNYVGSIADEFLAFTAFIINSCRAFPLQISLERVKKAANLNSEGAKKISIFPQSGNTGRVYPLSLFMEFAIFEKKNHPKSEIIFYVPSDQIGAYIGVDSINELKKNRISVVGLNDTAKISEVIKASNLVVTNNTGPMWIASAEGIPCIALFSSVVSKTHWLPSGVYQISRDTNCSPCYIAAADQCHRNMFCLNSIDPSYINSLVNLIFSGESERRHLNTKTPLRRGLKKTTKEKLTTKKAIQNKEIPMKKVSIVADE